MSLIVNDEIAICGDALFGVCRLCVLPPYLVDKEMLVRSWGKLLNTGCRLFLPSHGGAVSRERLQRAYDKRIMKFIR
jgi:hydroxyacylglutathione hydrolase